MRSLLRTRRDSLALILAAACWVSASLSVLLWALEPVLILLLARALLGETLGRGLLGLSALAVGGMVLILNASGSGASLLGVALTLAGIGCCALYSVITRRWLPGTDSTAPVVATQQLWALGFAIVLVGVVGLGGGSIRADGVSPAGWAGAVLSGVLYYAAAYWLYLSGLRNVPASIAASAFYLIPVFGVAGGGLLLGERLAGVQWIGVAIVVGAVIAILRRSNPYAARRSRRRSPSRREPQPRAAHRGGRSSHGVALHGRRDPRLGQRPRPRPSFLSNGSQAVTSQRVRDGRRRPERGPDRSS